MVTPTAIAMNIARSAQWSETKMAQFNKVIQSAAMDTIFTLRGIALCFKKFEM